MDTIPTNLKHFLILAITFGVVYWFQVVDDKKRCKERTGIYDKIKLPLLVTAIVGLIMFWDNDKILNVFVAADCNVPANALQEFSNPNPVNNTFMKPEVGMFKESNLFKDSGNSFKQPEFEVYTSLPEW